MLHKFYNILGIRLRSPKWTSVRKEHLKKQPFCQACGSIKDLDVHHIEPFHLNPDKELDPDNLITLCSKYCHYTIGHLMDYKSWNKDVVNDARVYLDKVKNRPYSFEVMHHETNIISYIHDILYWICDRCRNYRSTQ